MDNKYIFSENLKRLMNEKGVSRRDIADILKISYFTVSDWVNGRKYPRMDKVELLANYFGVLKSDLIEEAITEPVKNTVEELTDGEKQLLDLFRKVPETQQQMVLQMINVALKSIE